MKRVLTQDHQIKPVTQELGNRVLLVEAPSLLSLGRAAPCVPEWPWVARLGRGYAPAHLLDFLHRQPYGRVEAREGSLAASLLA